MPDFITTPISFFTPLEEMNPQRYTYEITDAAARTRIQNILGDIGSIEPAAAASKNYSAGEYLVLGDYFYKTTATIALGEELVEGTNIERTTVGAEFSTVGDRLYNALGNYAEVEAEGVASKNYVAGEFLVVNDQLYKTTAAITAGESLINHAHITRVTMDDELDQRPRFTISTTSTTSTGDGACTCNWIVKEYANKYVELFGRFSVSKKSYATFSTIFWAYFVDLKLPKTLTSSTARTVANWTIGNGFAIPSGVAGNDTTSIRITAVSSVNGSSTAQSCQGYVHISGYKS